MKPLLIPKKIKAILGSESPEFDSLGQSSAQVLFYQQWVLKVQPASETSENEKRMLNWLNDKLLVPSLRLSLQENGLNYLLMQRLSGEPACSKKFLHSQALLIGHLTEMLKSLWKVDVSDCPAVFDLDKKLKLAQFNVDHDLCIWRETRDDIDGLSRFENPAALLQWLKTHRPSEKLVFSHGDFTLANILIDQGKISGLVDLGQSGLADAYQDIALCYRSLRDNFAQRFGGDSTEDIDWDSFFTQLNLDPDWDKIKHYIRLDELF